GSFGDLGCFSFHPRKVITTGEGGIITTNNDELDDKLRKLRNHGMEYYENKNDFVSVGFNSRMTEMQAAIGIVQMYKIDEIISKRQKLAQLYTELLSKVSWIKTPQTINGANHIYQSYVILLKTGINRDRLIDKLRELGIETNIGTYAIHQTKYYRNKYGFNANDFPNARIAFEQSMALPLYPKMTEDDLIHISQKLIEVGNRQ
ncbi:MAG TPA: DegT/DnrJ/EryC1/StrS family aminotransferase, partial [bacterium]|nr:DegT/DnrJ/EryC1/StrS family aminotransferase [bacterium]